MKSLFKTKSRPFKLTFEAMNLGRMILAVVFPPLAVLDKGCGSIFIVVILTFFGWIPGVIAALIILNNTNRMSR